MLEHFTMSYCSTWLRSLLCYIKKFVVEEFIIRVFNCIYVRIYIYSIREYIHVYTYEIIVHMYVHTYVQ